MVRTYKVICLVLLLITACFVLRFVGLTPPHRWDTFVANRVTKIEEELSPQVLFHVSGRENPADYLSRGLTPAQIIDHPLWFSGPSWAQSRPTEWPVSAFNPTTLAEPPEEKKHSLVSSSSLEDSTIIAAVP